MLDLLCVWSSSISPLTLNRGSSSSIFFLFLMRRSGQREDNQHCHSRIIVRCLRVKFSYPPFFWIKQRDTCIPIWTFFAFILIWQMDIMKGCSFAFVGEELEKRRHNNDSARRKRSYRGKCLECSYSLGSAIFALPQQFRIFASRFFRNKVSSDPQEITPFGQLPILELLYH